MPSDKKKYEEGADGCAVSIGVMIFLPVIFLLCGWPEFLLIILEVILLIVGAMSLFSPLFSPDNTHAHNEPISENTRRPIPKDIQDRVWNRDGGKCVQCGSNENLEFDHIIPISKGGANTYRNIQLLCQKCNRSKHNKIG